MESELSSTIPFLLDILKEQLTCPKQLRLLYISFDPWELMAPEMEYYVVLEGTVFSVVAEGGHMHWPVTRKHQVSWSTA